MTMTLREYLSRRAAATPAVQSIARETSSWQRTWRLVVPLLFRPGERPNPLQKRVTIAAGTAMQAARRRYREVQPTRRRQRGVLAAMAISEIGRRDQAYGP